MKRLVACLVLLSFVLFSGCANADTSKQNKDNTGTEANQTTGKNIEQRNEDSGSKDNIVNSSENANSKADDSKDSTERELSMANDRIMQLESEVKGGENYRKELEKEIELINSFTKNLPYEQQLSIAQKQWHYSLRIDDVQITEGMVETDKTSFSITLSEGHDVLPLVPVGVFNKGKISGNTKDHIKFNSCKPSDMMEPAGGSVWGFAYMFNNVPHGTKVEVEISKELQERLGISTNIININVK